MYNNLMCVKHERKIPQFSIEMLVFFSFCIHFFNNRQLVVVGLIFWFHFVLAVVFFFFFMLCAFNKYRQIGIDLINNSCVPNCSALQLKFIDKKKQNKTSASHYKQSIDRPVNAICQLKE